MNYKNFIYSLKPYKSMAKVSFEYPVKDVCGKIGKDSAVGFAHRGSTKFAVRYGKRSTMPSESELAQRAKFKSVASATRKRLKDASKMAADQAAFAAQSAYKTLYQYVFNQEWNAYNA